MCVCVYVFEGGGLGSKSLCAYTHTVWLSGREKEREGGPAGKEGVVCMFASVCVYPREREVGGGRGEREGSKRERE